MFLVFVPFCEYLICQKHRKDFDVRPLGLTRSYKWIMANIHKQSSMVDLGADSWNIMF